MSENAHLQEIDYYINGMSCHSCAKTVADAIQKVPGVVSAQVNFATAKAKVFVNPPFDPHTLLTAVESAGYTAQLISHGEGDLLHAQHDAGEKQAFLRFIECAILSLPFLIQMLSMLTGHGFELPVKLQFVLATLIQISGGRIFYRASFYAARQGAANMDVLIALGTTAAYLLSLFIWLNGRDEPLYFETSAMIITLVLFGRWLESKSKGKASEAIGKLVSVQPKEATVERNGKGYRVPLEQVVKGDILLLQSGERIPVDARVIEGESEVDESMMTGESALQMKRPGDAVLAGTFNQNGALRIQADEVGATTVLAAMIRLVERAQQSKAPVQRLADKVSEIFVPAVLLISLMTWIGWIIAGSNFPKALIDAVTVLVIACPCALGLATPIVIVVASGRGAMSGFLFKEASSIELAHKINVLCFDKTGTLTNGKPTITDIVPFTGYQPNDVLQAAFSLESHVQHPLAKAIVLEAFKRELQQSKVDKFQSIPGKGAIGFVDGKAWGVGAIHFAKESGVLVEEKTVFSLEQEGKTVIVVWKDRSLIGYIAATDQLRDHCQQAIKQLKEYGIDLVMLTGDQKKTAEVIAKESGIDEFHATMMPQEKLDFIRRLKQEGKVVGMVGDGINDTPALSTADVGIALGAATDVAMEIASVVLLRNDLQSVPDVISLSRAAFRKIKQNLFFAFIYNAIGIPLAAFGVLNPVFAAAAMALSSLSVVFNALLLKRWRAN